MQATVVAYFAALIVFGGLDFIWLSFAAEAIYRPAIGDLLRPSFDAAPAVAFYLIYIGGLVVLVIRQAATPGQALIYGAVYGFCAYATYDLSNQATLRTWPMSLSLTDMAWGTFATAIAAAGGYIAYGYF
jgi:uncharacterized membrane protein